jgi:cathepsin L
VSPSEQYILDFAARRHATTCKDGEIASFGPDFLKDDEGTVSRTFAPATADGHPQAFHSAPKDEPRFKAADWSFVQAATNHADFAPVETSLIKQAIAKYGAVYVGMVATDAFGDFQNQPETATFAENVSPALLPDHAVVLLGWDETDGRNAWLVKNSWAKTNWGNNGFGYVRFGSDNIGSQALWIEAAPPVNGPGDIFGGNPEILRRIDYWEKSPFSRFVPKP